MPTNILNLPSYRVLKVDESEHDYHVRAEPVVPAAVCRHCASDRLTAWGTREQVFKDLPMHGKRVGIYIDTQRYRCQGCQRTFFQSLPDLAESRMMTDRLVKWIGERSLKRTFASLAEETGVVEGTIRNIFRDYVNELEKTIRFEVPRWMGIDEIHLIKPRCVISNIQNNTIVDMLHNRNKDTVAKYLTRMEHKERVQYVAMDMWTPYRDAVQAVLPAATIVIDKFHVVRMANDAIERVRKGLRGELTLKQKRGLMHDRFVLLKRERDLTDEDRLKLSGWVRNYPALGEAYRLKEGFYGIYENAKTPDEAVHLLSSWHRQITDELKPYFADLVRAVTNWEPFILNYFEHPVTNAYTESLNGLIRVMNRLGRGYSFEALRAKILFTEGIHKHKLTRPKFERQQRPVRRPAPEPEAELETMYGLATFSKVGPTRPPAPPKPPDQHAEPKTEKNYGADIATLIRMLEAGEL
jgi:transposase